MKEFIEKYYIPLEEEDLSYIIEIMEDNEIKRQNRLKEKETYRQRRKNKIKEKQDKENFFYTKKHQQKINRFIDERGTPYFIEAYSNYDRAVKEIRRNNTNSKIRQNTVELAKGGFYRKIG